MLTLCCTKVVRNRLQLPAQMPLAVQPTGRLGNWYVHLARFGHQQLMLATSERSLLTVLLPARHLRDTIEVGFKTAVAALLTALKLPTDIVNRELAAMDPIHFAIATNRRVIGSINDFVYQLGSYLARTSNPLELALLLNEAPMSAIGSKSSLAVPIDVARDLLMSWDH